MSRICAQTEREDVSLFVVLLVACAYSSHTGGKSAEGRAADALLSARDVGSHLLHILRALVDEQPDGFCDYQGVGWTYRDAGIYLRAVSLNGAQATCLARLGAPALLVQLLNRTTDPEARQHICRALLNFAFVPALRDGLRTAAVPEAVRPHVASADEKTAMPPRPFCCTWALRRRLNPPS